MSRYSTRDEAIQLAIAAPIGATGVVRDVEAEYDIAAIADLCLASDGRRWWLAVDEPEFWQTVADHATEEVTR